MSLEATRWAWGRKVRPAQKLVLLSLADRAGTGNRCWPSIGRIRADTGLDVKTVRAGLAGLCALGLISRERRPGRGYVYSLELEPAVQAPCGTAPAPCPEPEAKGAGTAPAPCPEPEPGGTGNGPQPLPETASKPETEPSGNRKQNRPRARAAEPSRFGEFWAAYPRKVGRKAALKAWENAKDKPDPASLLEALARQRASSQWRREGGRYIPNPATWLNQGRWDDEAEPPAPQGNDQTLEEYMAERSAADNDRR